MFLGNLDAVRDWGYAKEYVESMWLMLQQEEADDFVLATGVTYSVRHFCDLAFARAGITLKWEGEGVNEKGLDAANNRVLIEVDPRYFRPTEVELLIGNPAKAKAKLGWSHTYSLEQLVNEMVDSDITLFKRDRYLLDGGHNVLNYHE